MERIRLAHPLRRSLVLALLLALPLIGGALMLGANPMSLFVGGTGVGIVGALLFGGVVRWLPPLAFALVMLPTVVAAVPVFGGVTAVAFSLLIGGAAVLLFYRARPPEPPRPRASPYPRRDAVGRAVYGVDDGRTPASPGRGGHGRRD